MCGIVGSINSNWSRIPLDSICHRGPDSQGEFNFENVFLGHVRLSIQDLSQLGNQPMDSVDGKFTLIYNGEIYNHWEIRKKLLNKGYSFNSTSDSETLLYSWAEWGKKCINLFNGIFSFAIYDKEEKKMYLSRDRFGVKPLYYYYKDNSFAFSSEIKALLCLEQFDTTINIESIVNYLSFLWSPGKQTMYKFVHKLLPGQLLEINTSTLKIKETILSKNEFNSGDYWDYSEEEWISLIDESLNQAVENQLLSDAPLGFFLSGGLDSSLLVAIAKAHRPTEKLECFTIDQFKGASTGGFKDDYPYAKKVAKYLDVSLNVFDGRKDWVSSFDKMIWHLDEPQADFAPINVKMIAHFANNNGIKVLISGAGGDDIFSGYRRHRALLFNNKLTVFPKVFLKGISGLIQSFQNTSSKIRRLKKLTRDWGKDERTQILGYFNWLPSDEFINVIISERLKNRICEYDPYHFGKKQLSKTTNLSKIDQILYLEQTTFLIDHNLNYTDKLSMAEGVETRVPYLDFDLTKLAGHIPQNLKINKAGPKYILKKVAEKYLPHDVIYRSKTGFGAPVSDLIKNDFKKKISVELNKRKIEKEGIFNYSTIEKMVNNSSDDFNYNILSLLSIQSWLNQFPWRID